MLAIKWYLSSFSEREMSSLLFPYFPCGCFGKLDGCFPDERIRLDRDFGFVLFDVNEEARESFVGLLKTQLPLMILN